MGTEGEALAPLSPREAVALGAVDGVFFARHWFPRTYRQGTPRFHGEMWRAMDNPTARYLSFLVFRDGAKTTIARTATARRLAYGFSRTILYIGKAQDHAARSVEWILKQIEFNRPFAQTYGLEQGSKWTGTEVEIYNRTLNIRTRVIALGMTGSIRGVNVDDYRPDFIIGDDVVDEESTATPEQRQKVEDLWFGAVKDSLAPVTDNPDAKMVLLGTPLNSNDINMKCFNDPEWLSMRVGILDEAEQSVWPDRWTTKTVLDDKAAAVARGQTSLWLREKMCVLVGRESQSFPNPVKFWDILPDDESEQMVVILVIDPVPPRSAEQMARVAQGDWEVLSVLGRWRNSVFVLEVSRNQGHNPEWTVAEFFRLCEKWKPRKAIVIAYLYERTLKWLLERAMRVRGKYVQVNEHQYRGKVDRRSKSDRIKQGLAGIIANGELYVRREMTSLVEQIASYPTVSHDDDIETVAVGVEQLMTSDDLLPSEYEGAIVAERDIAPLEDWRACP